jgi:hypothetical protein
LRINLIKWLIDNYDFKEEDLLKELQYSFNIKQLGFFEKVMPVGSNIKGLHHISSIIDRLFIWHHADLTFNYSFSKIDSNWSKFVYNNNIHINNVYIDFNYLKKRQKLKIKFE